MDRGFTLAFFYDRGSVEMVEGYPVKVLCVLNPGAAGGKAASLWPDVAELLQRQGADFELLTWQKGMDLKRQVCDRLTVAGPGAYDVVAGIGGDGTHACVINGMMAYHEGVSAPPLPRYAFIPLGTGNDIAKSLGIRIQDDYSARDLRRAVSTIAHGADYCLDLGLINGLYFADALTVGLDSRILVERNTRKRAMEKIPLLNPFFFILFHSISIQIQYLLYLATNIIL